MECLISVPRDSQCGRAGDPETVPDPLHWLPLLRVIERVLGHETLPDPLGMIERVLSPALAAYFASHEDGKKPGRVKSGGRHHQPSSPSSSWGSSCRSSWTSTSCSRYSVVVNLTMIRRWSDLKIVHLFQCCTISQHKYG